MPLFRRMFIFNAVTLGVAFLCTAGNGFAHGDLNTILASIPLGYLASVFGIGAYEMQGLTWKPPVAKPFIFAIGMLLPIMIPSFIFAAEGIANEQMIVVAALISMGAVWFYREILSYEIYKFLLAQRWGKDTSKAE